MPSDRTHGTEPVELTVHDLLTRLRAIESPSGRTMIGLTGAPGAGKSTVAAVLHQQTGCSVVGMDGFHLAQQELDRLDRRLRKGAPDTFDAYGYAALLQRLRDNRDPVVYAPQFRRDLEEPINGCVPVPREQSLVLTEGNYLLLDEPGWTQARQQLDEVWFLELPDDVRQQRLALRHEQFGKAPELAREWATGSDQRNAVLVQQCRARADVVVMLVDPGDHEGSRGL